MYYENEPQCNCCGRDDVDLILVRKNIWYCNKHLPLFTKNWSVSPDLGPFIETNTLTTLKPSAKITT